MLVNSNFTFDHIYLIHCFRSERGQEKSACRVSFISVLHVKIIEPFRKADYNGASLKFAIFRHFVLDLKATDTNDSNSSKIHLTGVDKTRHTPSIEECLSLIYPSLALNFYSL